MSQLGDISLFFRRGTRLTLSKRLRPWVTIPLAFNILLFGFFYWLAGHYIHLWLDALVSGWHFQGFWSFLNAALPYAEGLLMLLIWLLLLVIFANIFTLVVQLIAAPFMGLLAERVNHDTCPVPLPEETTLSMIWRTSRREARKLWYWIWRAVLLLIVVVALYLVPGLNLLASIIWFAFNGWMMALQYIDYGADCRLVSLGDMNRRLTEKRWLVLGFGCIMLALTMLPLVNLVIMPLGVVTGTLIWNERLGRDLLSAPSDGSELVP